MKYEFSFILYRELVRQSTVYKKGMLLLGSLLA